MAGNHPKIPKFQALAPPSLSPESLREVSKMDAETEERDPFFSITKLCQPTASQEAKFPNCPFARESDIFPDLNTEQLSSSPDPTPSEPDGIVMVTPPGSVSSAQQQAEDDAVFHTPPEHHLPTYFSSEDQNLEELYSDAGASLGRRKKARVSEVGSDDELNSDRTSVLAEELHCGTVSAMETDLIVDEIEGIEGVRDNSERTTVLAEELAMETDLIVDEIEGNEGVHDETEVIDLDNACSGEEMAALDLVVRKACELSKDGVPEVSGVDGNCRSGNECESTEDAHVSEGERPHKDSCLSERLDSVESNKITIKLKCNGVTKIIHEGDVGGSKKVSEEKKKGIEKIDEFRYVGEAGSQNRWKDKTGGAVADNGFGGRRQLPVTLEGKGKIARGENAVELKSRLLDSLDSLKAMVGYMEGGCEDVDFLGTAKRRGVTFPRPRWWSTENEEEDE